MAPVIEFDNLSASYFAGLVRRETPAVRGVSFQVQAGEVFGFLGPNGAGKTTSIHVLMGFLFPTGGSARLFGLPAGDREARRRVGFLPENFAFHRFLTAAGLLRFHRRLAGIKMDGAGEQRLVQDLLHRVKLEAQSDIRIGRFSRGMIQRIGLAQTLLGDPDLLVLDEPTSGLDPVGRKEVRELILELKKCGKTVFLSSHLLSEIELVCDRVAVIDKGSLKHIGRISELTSDASLIELVISGLPWGEPAAEDLYAWIAAAGGQVASQGNQVKVVIGAAHKRALLEKVWASGADVDSLNPRRSTLEDLFLKLVGNS
jgi:ABC-2 type transport system ATP-binding protein